MRTLFFDTYAFFELFEGNTSYGPYAEGIAIITTKLNLMEFHYGLLIRCGKEVADANYYELLKFAVEVSDKTIIMANELKAAMKGKNVSYVDCIGYVVAITCNVPFLTGDKQFSRMDNVEYVE